MLASEPRTWRERSEPNHSLRGESPEGLPFGAGLGRREAQKKKRRVQGGEPCRVQGGARPPEGPSRTV